MTNRTWAAIATLLAPVLALAQRVANEQPVQGGGDTHIGRWIVAIVVIAAIAIALWRFRTMRRGGPHGPQAPTPRGP